MILPTNLFDFVWGTHHRDNPRLHHLKANLAILRCKPTR